MKCRELPQEFLDILEASRERFTAASWEMADLLSDLESELGRPLPRGKTADALGILPSQVSALILTAQRIEPKLRAKYDGLSFSCFQYAARDIDPAIVLRIAVESAEDYGGKPGGVRVVRAIVFERRNSNKNKDTKQAWSGNVVYDPDRGWMVILDIAPEREPISGSPVTVREV